MQNLWFLVLAAEQMQFGPGVTGEKMTDPSQITVIYTTCNKGKQ